MALRLAFLASALICLVGTPAIPWRPPAHVC